MSLRDRIQNTNVDTTLVEQTEWDFEVYVRRLPVTLYPLLERLLSRLPSSPDDEKKLDDTPVSELDRGAVARQVNALAESAALLLCEEDGTFVYPVEYGSNGQPSVTGAAELADKANLDTLRAIVTAGVTANAIGDVDEAAKD